jgi:hypothetical protein
VKPIAFGFWSGPLGTIATTASPPSIGSGGSGGSNGSPVPKDQSSAKICARSATAGPVILR